MLRRCKILRMSECSLAVVPSRIRYAKATHPGSESAEDDRRYHFQSPLNCNGPAGDDVELKLCYAHPQVRQHLRILGLDANDAIDAEFRSRVGMVHRSTVNKPTLKSLKHAYHHRAMLVHPDAGLSGNPERFVEITEAYKALLAEHDGLVVRNYRESSLRHSASEGNTASAQQRHPRGLWDVPLERCSRMDKENGNRLLNRLAVFGGILTGLAMVTWTVQQNEAWAAADRQSRRELVGSWEREFFEARGTPVPQVVRSSAMCQPRRNVEGRRGNLSLHDTTSSNLTRS